MQNVSWGLYVYSHRLVNFHSWIDTCYTYVIVCTMIFPVASTNTLTVMTNPADSDGFPDNRLAVTVGNNQVLRCVGSGSSSPPSVVWVRNGEQVVGDGGRITITEGTLLSVQRSSELWTTNFGLSDAGVYQCIFTVAAEVITTRPLRLDAGWLVSLLLRLHGSSPMQPGNKAYAHPTFTLHTNALEFTLQKKH